MYFQSGKVPDRGPEKSAHKAGAVQSRVFAGGFRKGASQDAARRVAPAGWPGSAIGDVHRDFKAKAHVAGSGFFPFHAVSPVCLSRKTRLKYPQRICWHGNHLLCFVNLQHRENMDWSLMIFMRFQSGDAACCASGRIQDRNERQQALIWRL